MAARDITDDPTHSPCEIINLPIDINHKCPEQAAPASNSHPTETVSTSSREFLVAISWSLMGILITAYCE